MTMFAPSSYQELLVMLSDAMSVTDGPVSIRWPKTPAPSVPEQEVGGGLSARKVQSGDDVCLIGVGKMLSVTQEAAEVLEADGITVTVWDPRVVKPLDSEMIADAARHELVVAIEDGLRDGGVGARIRDEVEALVDGTHVSVLGVPTTHIPHGKPDQILAALGLDAAGVVEEVRRRR
jgi:1-deoxy-D-xylulose-5-phosphate synthase